MTNRVSIIDWSEQLATGVPRIDAEHRRLIDLINELGVLHRSQATVAQLRAALADLRNYAEYHFQTEADLMQIHPVDAGNRRVHLAAHQGFVDQLERVNALVATDPAAVIEHLLAFMMKWLLHHITGVDARMAREIISLEMGISDGDGGDGGANFTRGSSIP